MKKLAYILLAALLVGGVVFATQDSALSQREVRDPLQLESWLETNAADAETRLAAIEGGTATVTQETDNLLVGNDSSNQVAMAVIGDVTISQDGTNVTTALAADTVGTAEFANADWGDMTVSSGVVSLDAGVVGTNEMDSGLVSTSLDGVTNFDITIVNGVITEFISN